MRSPHLTDREAHARLCLDSIRMMRGRLPKIGCTDGGKKGTSGRTLERLRRMKEGDCDGQHKANIYFGGGAAAVGKNNCYMSHSLCGCQMVA